MLELLLKGAVIGFGATLLMDIWAFALHFLLGEAKPNWAPGGRWFYHLGRGKVFHEDIGKAEPYAHENALGWVGHYAVGIFYGIILAVLVGAEWFTGPTFIPAWLLGIVTIGAGWFLMQPGMGLGWAASKTANPAKVRLMNFAAHTIFAIGLYGTALLLM
ncbi:hypothetical protein J2T09_001707 [Neorhizobium huautlense]|uniref:DUF2938 domain-containing protein n=1 Tax=Neorhizobium huautlense TaxID=67774 RepID=A0ABT9PR79_9HYPH|nr:DUF2938 domain-containing protein [Neorhizobium huautlense]MDP9836962.1 hypothetical protein [Neorhizobium huautlense]